MIARKLFRSTISTYVSMYCQFAELFALLAGMFWNENASKTKMLSIIYRLKIFLLGYACIDPIIRRCYFIIILVLYNSYWMLQAGTSASNIVSFELVCQQNTRNPPGRMTCHIDIILDQYHCISPKSMPNVRWFAEFTRQEAVCNWKSSQYW